jgi:acetyltransferase-like isoleucine patch superfamily enzyme
VTQMLALLLRKLSSARYYSRRLSPQISRKLRAACLNLRPGVRVASDSFVARSAKILLNPDGTYRGGQVTISSNCRICEGALLSPYGGVIELEEGVFIGPYCVIQSNKGSTLRIGRNTMIAGHTFIVPDRHGIEGRAPIWAQPVTSEGITIENDVWIGAGVQVLDGVYIQEGAVIGAGSVVTRSVPSFAIAVGSPARVIRMRLG